MHNDILSRFNPSTTQFCVPCLEKAKNDLSTATIHHSIFQRFESRLANLASAVDCYKKAHNDWAAQVL